MNSGAVRRALDELKAQQFLFEQEGAWWFRSSAFGDEKDRVVQKQDGEYTYLASDIAYHQDKLRRGYDLLIDVWGADHHGYIPRMQAVVQAYGHPKDRLQVVLVQMVNLLRGGKKVEMSKRAGEFITMREVIDEVGADAAKFFFLMRDSKSHLDFDLELAKQRSSDNPVYYVQYAHARIASLRRVAATRGIACPLPSETDLTVLTDPDELGLIRKLSAYPSVLQGSAVAYEPHRMTYYLQQLAGLLHTFYNKHRILPPAADRDLSAVTPEGLASDEVLQKGGAVARTDCGAIGPDASNPAGLEERTRGAWDFRTGTDVDGKRDSWTFQFSKRIVGRARGWGDSARLMARSTPRPSCQSAR